jgi:hypothetical protein
MLAIVGFMACKKLTQTTARLKNWFRYLNKTWANLKAQNNFSFLFMVKGLSFIQAKSITGWVYIYVTFHSVLFHISDYKPIIDWLLFYTFFCTTDSWFTSSAAEWVHFANFHFLFTLKVFQFIHEKAGHFGWTIISVKIN